MQATRKQGAHEIARRRELNLNILRAYRAPRRQSGTTLKFRHVGCRTVRRALMATSAVFEPLVAGADARGAIRWLSAIRSREDTASRSAARQTTLSSNSLTSPSA